MDITTLTDEKVEANKRLAELQRTIELHEELLRFVVRKYPGANVALMKAKPQLKDRSGADYENTRCAMSELLLKAAAKPNELN